MISLIELDKMKIYESISKYLPLRHWLKGEFFYKYKFVM